MENGNAVQDAEKLNLRITASFQKIIPPKMVDIVFAKNVEIVKINKGGFYGGRR